MASYPTYQPSIYVGPQGPEEARSGARTRRWRTQTNHPGHQPRDRRAPIRRARRSSRSPRSPRCRRASSRRTTRSPARRTTRPRADLPQLDAADRSAGSTLPTALAESCDTYFYELGKRFYKLPRDRGHPLQGWANRFGLGDADRHRRRSRGRRADADAGVARKHFAASAGYGDVDRTWKPGYSIQMAIGQGQILGDAAPDGAPLRDDRERRQARHAASRRGRRADRPERQPPRSLRRFGAQPPQPTGVDPTALALRAAGPRRGDALAVRHVVGVFGKFPVNIAGKTGTRREERHAAGLPALRSNLTSRGGAATGRTTSADDRRLRRDRERRPRRHRGGAGGAQGVRAVLRQGRHHHDPHASD